jgi:chromosome segregation ATPase
LEVETGKLRQEVLTVQERNGFLQSSVDEYRRQLENQQELATIMRSEYEKKLKDERDAGYSHIQALQERLLQADLEKAQAVKEAHDLQDSLNTAQRELTTLREQVQNLHNSISEWANQAKELTVRNHALQAENIMLLEKGNTIGARYDANDLVRCEGIILGQH